MAFAAAAGSPEGRSLDLPGWRAKASLGLRWGGPRR